MPYDELEQQAAITLDPESKLPSELAATVATRAEVWYCEGCPRSFDSAVGLRNHSAWCTGRAPAQRVDEPLKRVFKGTLTLSLGVGTVAPLAWT